jgi:hypothetical protein
MRETEILGEVGTLSSLAWTFTMSMTVYTAFWEWIYLRQALQ